MHAKTVPAHGRTLLAFGLAALTSTVGLGQSTTTEADDEDIIELSPFEVDASNDVGYLANSTLAGGRMNTSLFTTPQPVSVLTKELLSDLGTTDVLEAMKYAVNADPEFQYEESSNFRANIESKVGLKIRGFSSVSARNYFAWESPSDAYNVERLDQSRGPNAVLFGTGAVGGMVNTTTKQARIGAQIKEVSATFGSWARRRFTFDYNQSVGRKAAVRVNGVTDHRETFVNHAYTDREALSLNAVYQPFKHTTIRFDTERGVIDSVIGRQFPGLNKFAGWDGQAWDPRPGMGTVVPLGTSYMESWRRNIFINADGYLMDASGLRRTNAAAGGSGSVEEDLWGRNQNFHGPDDYNDQDYENYSVFVTQRIGDLWLEVAANNQWVQNDRIDISRWEVFRDPNLYIRDVNNNWILNPRLGEAYVEGGFSRAEVSNDTDEIRATASYRLDLGAAGRHQFAALAARKSDELRSMTSYLSDQNRTNGANIRSGNGIRYRAYLADGDAAEYTSRVDFGESNGRKPIWIDNRFRNDYTRQTFYQMSYVGNFLENDRLTVIGGIRRDKLEAASRGSSTSPNGEQVIPDEMRSDYTLQPNGEATTSSLGATVAIVSGISAFVNVSENFNAQGGRDIFYAPLGAALGKGQDAGLRFRVFGDALYASITGYQTEESNRLHYMHGWIPGSIRNIWDTIPSYLGTNQGGFQASTGTESEGLEFELSGNITDNWRIWFNVSKNKTVESGRAAKTRAYYDEHRDEWYAFANGAPTTESPQGDRDYVAVRLDRIDQALGWGDSPGFWIRDNELPLRHRNYRGNLFTNYSFNDGTLKGLSVGFGLTYRSAAKIDADADGDIWGNDRFEGELKLGWNRRLSENIDWTIQLNVKNLFNNDIKEVNGAPGSSQEGGSVYYNTPRHLFVTNTFRF